MNPPDGPLWRAFPWDPGAAEGQRFSAVFVPPSRGVGRFDLPGDTAGVLYLAESPAHAIAEKIQDLRNQQLTRQDLAEGGHPYALSELTMEGITPERIADLCDAEVLHRLGISPDQTSARNRTITQQIALRVRNAGFAGLRWWSVFFGEWHTVVLFKPDSVRVRFGEPHPLLPGDAHLAEAARALAIEVQTS